MWDHCSIIAWRAVQSLRTIIEMVPTLFYLLIFQGDRKVYISHEMKKQLFLLLFVLLVTGCSDDIPNSDYLDGDVRPKRLVSKIQQTNPDYQSSCRTWTFEYDDQNRIVKIDEKYLSDRPQNEPYYENITNITYNVFHTNATSRMSFV